MFAIVDVQTGKQVGAAHATRRAAARRADRMDLQYGAVRYMVREILEAAAQDAMRVAKEVERINAR